MKHILPALLERKGDMLILHTIIAYALLKNPKDEALFFKAIEGVTDDQILRRQDTTEVIAAGLKAFGQEERAKRLLKSKRNLDKGLSG